MKKLKLFRSHPDNVYGGTWGNHLGVFASDEKEPLRYVRKILWNKLRHAGIRVWSRIESELR